MEVKPVEQAAVPRGEALVQQLRKGWAPLPNRTVLALAMGGLKVRMMRSTITMVSVVLAIAFLTYMGLVSRLTKNLIAEMDRLEAVRAVDATLLADATKVVLAQDYFGGKSLEQKKNYAIDLGLGDPSAAELENQGLPKQIRDAVPALENITKVNTAIIQDPKALAGDKVMAKGKIDAAVANLAALKKRQSDNIYHIAFCVWLRAKDPAANMPEGGKPPEQHLGERLTAWYASHMAGLTQLNRMSDTDLVFVRRIADELKPKLPAASATLLTEAFAGEEAKRDAGAIRTSLVRNGINIETSRTSSAAEYWLGGMSLLTCAIGIANAMLMSVTERFREIGTMKCLGAQDGLVIKLFLIESAFLGVIGAIAGIIFGVLVSVIAGVAQFGVYGLSSFPVSNGFPVLGMSVLGGIILAVLGAIGPARMAAQMRPVDALRVDE